MAIYKIFPEKDATLYSAYPTQNTGLDEIIEVTNTFLPDTPEVSRFLIKFSTTEINSVINTIISGSVTDSTGSLLPESKKFKSNLRCFISEVSGLNTDTTLEVYPIAESWAMGTGKFLDDPITTSGCSWVYKDGNIRWATASFTPGTTASYDDNNPGGGNWYTGSVDGLSVTGSQIFSYSDDKDLNIDVTNTIKLVNSESLVNEGFIVKQKDDKDFLLSPSATDVAIIKYFSIDTNTIYPPQLEFKWRDYTFNTGSSTNTIIDDQQLIATLANNIQEYRKDSINKFYINCRPQYPVRTFRTSSVYTTNYFLPTASYYAVKDLHTNEFIIDFDDDYTQISADENGSYFKLYMNGLEPERYYQILIKTTIQGSTIILDDNYYFKVING
jgi:hypothetical protein